MTTHCIRRRRGRGRSALRLSFLLVWAVSTAAPPAGAGQEVELTWNPEPGTELVYEFTAGMEMETPAMPSMGMEFGFTERWQVLDRDGVGNITVRTTTERVRMSADGPMGPLAFDSADDSAAASPFAPFGRLAGTSLTIVMDPQGALVEVSGLAEIRDRLQPLLAANPMMAGMFEPMLSEEGFRGQWAQRMATFPTGPVEVGSTWESSYNVPNPALGEMTIATVQTVEALEGGVLVMGIDGTISSSGEGGDALPIAMQMDDSTVSGTIRIDIRRGVMLSSESRTTMKATVAMGPQSETIESRSTIRVELLEGPG